MLLERKQNKNYNHMYLGENIFFGFAVGCTLKNWCLVNAIFGYTGKIHGKFVNELNSEQGIRIGRPINWRTQNQHNKLENFRNLGKF